MPTGWCLLSNRKSWLITLAGGAPTSTGDSDGTDRTALQAGLDLALAAGAFGQRVTLVFAGGGVDLVTHTTDAEDPLYRLLGSAPFYDIDLVYVLDGATSQTIFRDDLHVTAMSHNEWLAAAGEAHVVINY
ncbi:DsrE family protein [Luminiphilus sp.]|nr:DsrE family protein [Luminiphilus sp.]MDA9797904.1 DsrE family protein [Luminiphilus sp.]